jgi:hypothetical protein
MTEGECHCERSVAISGKQKSKIKKQNDRAKIKKVVRGFSLVHDPEG